MADLRKMQYWGRRDPFFWWLMFESRVSWNSLGRTRVVKDRVRKQRGQVPGSALAGSGPGTVGTGQLVEGPAGVGCLRGSSGSSSRSVQPSKK